MKSASAIAALAVAMPFALATTPITQNNGVSQWLAVLPEGKEVTGQVLISQGPGGIGIGVQATFAGFPTDGGPFLYHIHEKPLSPDGNCSSAGKHLSPFPSQSPCQDPNKPADCEAGDLSGKHVKINSTEFSANYADDYVSNNDQPGCTQCMTGRSLVVHFANKTAITCANFTLVESTGSSTLTTISGDASTISGDATTISGDASTMTQSATVSASGSAATQTTASTLGGAASHPTAAALALAFAGVAALLA